MALKIRLRRMGRRNAPTYRIVVAESSMPRDGRIVDSIGHYNPRTEPLTLSVDRGKALEWIDKGAIPTETAKALLKKAGVFRPEEAGVLATVAETATKGARQVGAAAKAAVAKVADVVEDVVERVTGGAEPEAPAGAGAAEAAVDEAPAVEGGSVTEAPAADAETIVPGPEAPAAEAELPKAEAEEGAAEEELATAEAEEAAEPRA